MVNKHMAFTALVSMQASPEVTINAALDRIAAGLNNFLSLSAASGNVTVTDDQYGGNFLFRITGHSVARNFTVPLEIDTSVDSPRLFAVDNQGTATVTVTGGSGNTVLVRAGTLAIIHSDGINLQLVANNAAAIGFDFPGLPTNAQVLGRVMITEYIELHADFLGSSGYIVTPPTDGDMTIDVKVNGSTIGTIVIDDPAGTFTFATVSNTAKQLVPGDRLEFVGPNPADTDAADIAATLRGKKK